MIIPPQRCAPEGLNPTSNLISTFAHRGLSLSDLTTTLASAECHLHSLPPSSPSLPSAHLGCGIARLLRGEPLAAFPHFKNAAQSNADPAPHHLALCYALHCLFLTYSWAASGQTVPADEMDPLYDMGRAIPVWTERITSLEQQCGGRGLSGKLRVLLERQRAVAALPMGGERQRDMAVEVIGEAGNLVEEGVPSAVVAPGVLEMAGVWRRAGGGLGYAEEVVKWLQEGFQMEGDEVGVAYCEVAMGDLVSAPAGPVEYWGVMVRPGLDRVVSEPMVGDGEVVVAAEEIDEAASHYEIARVLFEQSESKRGLATVELRNGYLAVLRARLVDGSLSGLQEALHCCSTAEAEFEACGDTLSFQTARAHAILCRVALGQRPEDTVSAREIGTWGRTDGSISYAMGLGLFLAAQARRWTADEGDYEKGVAALRLAEALFDGLGLPRSCTAAIADQMSVHDMLGEHDRFVITAERALKVYTGLADDASSPSLAAWARTRSADVLGRMVRRAIEREDPDQIASAVSRLRSIHSASHSGSSSHSATVDLLSDLIRKMDMAIADPASCPSIDDLDDIDVNLVGEAASAQSTQTLVDAAEFQELMFRAKHARRGGDMDEADAFWDRAEKKVQESQDPHMGELLMANIAADRKQYDVSAAHLRAYCESRLEAAADLVRRSDQSVADIVQLFGQQSAEIYALVFPGLARVKQFGDAEEMLDALVKERGEDWWKVGDAVGNLTAAAEVMEGQAQFPHAWKLYQQAIQIFEDRRARLSVDEFKMSLAGSSRLQGLYFKAARTAIKWHSSSPKPSSDPAHPHQVPQRLEDAFRTLEQGKARSLLDLMAAGSLMYGSLVPSEITAWDEFKHTSTLLATKRGLLRQQYALEPPNTGHIQKLEAEISEAESQLGQQEEHLFANESPSARRFVTPTDVTDINTLRTHLDKNTAVLQYSYRGDDFLTWAITTDGMIELHHRAVSEVDLELHARRFREQCHNAAPPDTQQPDARWLSTLLFPFSKALSKAHLILIPYRALHTLPFHALPLPNTTTPLLTTHTISYLPSATCITHLPPSPPPTPNRVLAIGSPSNMLYHDPLTGTTDTLLALPFAAAEARAVAAITAPDSVCLVGSEATKSAVTSRLKAIDTLHLATHGLLCAEVPMHSSVALADGEELTVGELLGGRTGAKLVVLSACETGVGGTVGGGEGDDVVGFVRSLLAVGVKGAVVSLWAVSDRATGVLMGEFYRGLGRGEGPAEALARAQRLVSGLGKAKGQEEVRSVRPEKEKEGVSEYAHPRLWAPFIFVGVR
ncbi:Tetratricopeptide repeat protein 28 [Staphylotrichum tortipilum]|uniref:Tetratricopeptide repeat protein 28 n=1 Tax=Staphylotrichum tortipilum TaxID=2831512 RepID=A0AAN6MR16_9PEZI|nr:Tetratricopeptide repeat protein 28 [Staphylotrichum longicolle]